MKLLDKLERKFGRYGIPNLTMYVCICYVVGYLVKSVSPEMISVMSLNVSMILKGQLWRLFTWVIYPPTNTNFLLFLISIAFFYYPIGTMLERTWGSFRYTLYIFTGLFLTIIAAFLLHFITGGTVTIQGLEIPLSVFGSIFTTYYVSLSVFLAYAMSYPEEHILLWFIIPIKMKWMAYVYIGLILYEMISYLRAGLWFMAFPIVASLLNFVLFYFGMKDMHRYNPKEIRRRQQFKKAVSPGRADPRTGGISKHKCAICGRTELDDPNLEFRFCSKCDGNYEYCQDHLFTHQHVKKQ